MRNKKAVLTDQELEMTKIVWKRGSATVRDVYEELLERRKIAYTTVMTIMGILEQKGQLKKTMRDRAYVYSPAQRQDKVVRKMVRDFVSRVYDGSAAPLLIHLVENSKMNAEELDELQKLVERKKEEA